MNNGNNSINMNDIVESIEELSSSFVTLISEAKEDVLCVFEKEEIKDAITILGDVGKGLSDAIAYIDLLQTVASIPTKLFMNKFKKYMNGIVAISYDKRQKYLERVGKSGLNKDSVFILNVLNRIEELSKIDLMLILFEAKINEKISDDLYRRLTLMVDKTMYSDLLYLKNHIKKGCFMINGIEEEALLSNGFLLFVGIGMGSASEVGGNLYQYTNAAILLCKIIFSLEEITLVTRAGGIHAITTQ